MQHVPTDGVTVGEIMFRGNQTMMGYLKDPEATDRAFEGGWFHTGDLAVLEADSYARIKDRSKDIIISGGENISSVEVEDSCTRTRRSRRRRLSRCRTRSGARCQSRSSNSAKRRQPAKRT